MKTIIIITTLVFSLFLCACQNDMTRPKSELNNISTPSPMKPIEEMLNTPENQLIEKRLAAFAKALAKSLEIPEIGSI